MRPREDELIDPEIAEQLDAIDATLAGDPVDPRFAELAELALLLAAARPEAPRPEFAQELDRRVQARFRPRPDEPASAPAGGGGRPVRRWRLTPAWGAAGTALAAVVVGVAVVSSGGGGPSTSNGGARALALSQTPVPSARVPERLSPTGTSSASSSAAGRTKAAPPALHAPVPASAAPGQQSITAGHGAATSSAGAATSSPGAVSVNGPLYGPASTPTGSGVSIGTPSPTPVPNGRKIIQSSSLQLGAPANRIDAVAQEVFNVVGTFQGIVDSSNVASTGGPGASADFRLRIPSAALPQALSALSRLHYASVVSRIDNTQDVNSSFVSARRQIADAQSAIARLRVKLAAATTQSEILSLQAQIANENAAIRRAQASLRSLGRQVDYSRVYVNIQADAGVPPPIGTSGTGGFGLHQAGHDALRVLEVSAAVALIALAVMVPIGLLAGLGWWVGLTVQRRRRERALDLA